MPAGSSIGVAGSSIMVSWATAWKVGSFVACFLPGLDKQQSLDRHQFRRRFWRFRRQKCIMAA
jgi:hypothetical protein